MKSKLFRMDEETFYKLNIELAKKNTSFQKLVEKAIEEFLDSCKEVEDE